MKKSSLGMRRSRSSDDNKRNSARTLIPRPARSRSSSTDHNFAAANRPMALLATPIGTPMQGLMCGSALKFKGFCENSASKAPKDLRPLSDRNFQTLALQNIRNYFEENKVINIDVNSIPKTASSCPFTLKLFVDMNQHLLGKYFKDEVINMTNYKELIPICAKNLCYPNIVKKSWLVTANSSHSLPQVIGWISWLVDGVDEMSECKPELMFPPSENADVPIEVNYEEMESFNPVSSKRMLEHYFECVGYYTKGQTHVPVAQKLKKEVVDIVGVNDNDFRDLDFTLSKLKQELEKPEVIREIAENKNLEDEKAKLYNGLCMDEKYIQEKVAYCNIEEQNVEELKCTVAKLEDTVEKCDVNKAQMSKQLNTQRFTPEDLECMEKRCKELEEGIQLDENVQEMWNNENYMQDIQMAKVRSDLNVVHKDYTSFIIRNIDIFPDFENLKVQVNLLKNDASIQLQEIDGCRCSYIKKLEVEKQDLETIIDEKEEQIETVNRKVQQLSEKECQERKNVENLKKEWALLNNNLLTKKHVETLELLQDEITAFNDDMWDSAVLEKKLQELLEADLKVSEHIDSVRDEEFKHFEETGQLYRKYADKTREAVKPFFEVFDKVDRLFKSD